MHKKQVKLSWNDQRLQNVCVVKFSLLSLTSIGNFTHLLPFQSQLLSLQKGSNLLTTTPNNQKNIWLPSSGCNTRSNSWILSILCSFVVFDKYTRGQKDQMATLELWCQIAKIEFVRQKRSLSSNCPSFDRLKIRMLCFPETKKTSQRWKTRSIEVPKKLRRKRKICHRWDSNPRPHSRIRKPTL